MTAPRQVTALASAARVACARLGQSTPAPAAPAARTTGQTPPTPAARTTGQTPPTPAARTTGPAGLLAVALAVLMLAACTAGRTGGAKPGARSATFGGPRKVRLGPAGPGRQGSVSFRVGGGPGGGAFVGGPGGPIGSFIALPPGGPAGGTGRPHILMTPIPPANSAVTVALPLDSYEEVAVQEQDALAAAGDLLTQRCMTAAGFSYPAAASPGRGAANVQFIEDANYGVASLSQAETYGYGQAGQNLPPGVLGALPGFVSQLSKHGSAWTSALLGFVPGARVGGPQHTGCLQAADTELYGKLGGNPDPDPVPGIAGEAAQWTQSDPHVLAVDRAWSACMARSGFNYKSPMQAAFGNWPSTPTPAEIATATADVRCKTQTNLVNTWLTVEAAYQAALIGQNLTSLSQLQTTFGALERRAELLLQLPGVATILRISQRRAGQGRGGRPGRFFVQVPSG